MNIHDETRAYLSHIGKRGGSVRSKAKSDAAKQRMAHRKTTNLLTLAKMPPLILAERILERKADDGA